MRALNLCEAARLRGTQKLYLTCLVPSKELAYYVYFCPLLNQECFILRVPVSSQTRVSPSSRAPGNETRVPYEGELRLPTP